MSEQTRREFVVGALVGGSGLVLGCGNKPLECPLDADTGIGSASPDACEPTMEQIEGPFYRAGAPERSDLNASGQAGTRLTIVGTVFGAGCAAGLTGATVEVWQADDKGSYDNESDDFDFRATVPVADDGSYAFETLLPGTYLNGSQYRPRHIHFLVTAPGHQSLITQLYFCGDPYLADDPFQDASLVIALDDDGGDLSGRFDVVLTPE
jgi:catechol 1,2-dioxygenase